MDAVATQTPIMPPMAALSCESSDQKEAAPNTVRTYCRWTRARVDGIAAMKPSSLPEYTTAKGMNIPMARFSSRRCAACRSCNTVDVSSGSAVSSHFLVLAHPIAGVIATAVIRGKILPHSPLTCIYRINLLAELNNSGAMHSSKTKPLLQQRQVRESCHATTRSR